MTLISLASAFCRISAQIGISVANRLSNFALTADARTTAVVLAHWFSGGYE